MRGWWLVPLGLACASCALEARLRVVTTARERCAWEERVVLVPDGDKVEVPAAVTDARVALGAAEWPLAPGARVRVATEGPAGAAAVVLTVDGAELARAAVPAGVSVRWCRTEERDVEAARELPIPDGDDAWPVDLDVRPVARRVPDGTCDLCDVRTRVEIVGPDAARFAFAAEGGAEPGRVRGAVRRAGGAP